MTREDEPNERPENGEGGTPESGGDETPENGGDGSALARPEFVPSSDLSHERMVAMQREIAAVATFVDDVPFDPGAVNWGEATDLTAGVPEPVHPDATGIDPGVPLVDPDAPVVVGIDQAFLDDRVVSAIVATRDGRVVERAHAVSPLTIPYVPGLLSFREGGPILDAFEALSVDPDLALLDGSGRIHYREAGIATHVGVVRDLPSVGVAKRLLCGTPDDDVNGRPEGWKTPIRADERVEAPAGTVIGYAYQSRQYPESRRVNPLYVSPGHRLSAETAVDLVSRLCAGYKLPEPTRLADAYADEVKRSLE